MQKKLCTFKCLSADYTDYTNISLNINLKEHLFVDMCSDNLSLDISAVLHCGQYVYIMWP